MIISKVKFLWVILVILILPLELKSQNYFDYQSNSILTQNWEMPTLLNPGAAGGSEFLRIRGAARLQWLGLYQSPKNFYGSIDAPIKISDKNIGVGVILDGSSYGFFQNILLGAQGSYKFKLKSGNLEVGLQLGYFHSKFNGSKIETNQEMSQISTLDEDKEISDIPRNDLKDGKFDLGLGIRYDHQFFNIGLSALHITNSTIKHSENKESTPDVGYVESKLPATFYFNFGGNIPLKNSLFKLQPSLLFGTDFDRFNAVVEMRTTYNKKVTFGLNYRWNEAFGILAGLYLKDFYVGYSWEYAYNHSAKGSTGNHELVIGYQIKIDQGTKKKYSQKSIRLM